MWISIREALRHLCVSILSIGLVCSGPTSNKMIWTHSDWSLDHPEQNVYPTYSVLMSDVSQEPAAAALPARKRQIKKPYRLLLGPNPRSVILPTTHKA